MKRLLSLIFWGNVLVLSAQTTPQPDSLRLWFDVSFNDSARQVTLRPKLLNRSGTSGYFYYQMRVTDATLRPGEIKEKTNGVVLALPFDTTELTEKTLPFDPSTDFNVFIYLLDEECQKTKNQTKTQGSTYFPRQR
jgi:hypothetical protein